MVHWHLVDIQLPMYKKEKTEVIDKPFNIRTDTLIFYERSTQRLHIGYYDGELFISYIDNGEIIGKYNKNTVSCWLYAKDLAQAHVDNKFEKDTLLSLPHSDLVFFFDDINIGEITPNISVLDRLDVLYQYISVLPPLPPFVNTYTHKFGNYRWNFVDDKDGIFTYNIDIKLWYGWLTIKAISTTCHQEAYDYAEELLNLLNKKI